jgi:hypothetical protein
MKDWIGIFVLIAIVGSIWAVILELKDKGHPDSDNGVDKESKD